MPKYAQIHNNRVHWVFEHAAKNVTMLYDKYFCREHIEIVSLDDSADVTEGMTAEFLDGAYVFTLSAEPLAQTLAQLENDKQQAAQALIWAERDACMLGNTYRQSELKKLYKALVAAYDDILALSADTGNADGVITMLTNFIEQLRNIDYDINN